jgi:transcriptional regulator with XRE-family HTH domain
LNSLKQARERAGLSYRKAAKELEIALSTLQRWEAPTFRPERLPLETLCKLARCYAVPLSDLTTDSSEAQSA